MSTLKSLQLELQKHDLKIDTDVYTLPMDKGAEILKANENIVWFDLSTLESHLNYCKDTGRDLKKEVVSIWFDGNFNTCPLVYEI